MKKTYKKNVKSQKNVKSKKNKLIYNKKDYQYETYKKI